MFSIPFTITIASQITHKRSTRRPTPFATRQNSLSCHEKPIYEKKGQDIHCIYGFAIKNLSKVLSFFCIPLKCSTFPMECNKSSKHKFDDTIILLHNVINIMFMFEFTDLIVDIGMWNISLTV